MILEILNDVGNNKWNIKGDFLVADEYKRQGNLLVLKLPRRKYQMWSESYEPACFRVYKILTSSKSGRFLSAELIIDIPLRKESK